MKNRRIYTHKLFKGARYSVSMRPRKEDTTPDEPLPGTLKFVLVMGAGFIILWFLLFVLLKARW